AQFDSDFVNRFLAFKEIYEDQLLKLLEDPQSEVQDDFADLYFSFISNQRLCSEMGATMLVMFETLDHPHFKNEFWMLFEAKKKIKLFIARKFKTELLDIF